MSLFYRTREQDVMCDVLFFTFFGHCSWPIYIALTNAIEMRLQKQFFFVLRQNLLFNLSMSSEFAGRWFISMHALCLMCFCCVHLWKTERTAAVPNTKRPLTISKSSWRCLKGTHFGFKTPTFLCYAELFYDQWTGGILAGNRVWQFTWRIDLTPKSVLHDCAH